MSSILSPDDVASQVLEKGQRRLIGPMEVINKDDQGAMAREGNKKLDNSLEQATAFSVGVQGNTVGEIWQGLAQLGDQLAHFSEPKTGYLKPA